MEQDNNEATPRGEFEQVIQAKDTLIRKLRCKLTKIENVCNDTNEEEV